jgi:hypothetical protein
MDTNMNIVYVMGKHEFRRILGHLLTPLSKFRIALSVDDGIVWSVRERSRGITGVVVCGRQA